MPFNGKIIYLNGLHQIPGVKTIHGLAPKFGDRFGESFPKLCGAMDGGAQASHGCAARSVFWKALPKPIKLPNLDAEHEAGEHK
ncbi:hypothetical protein MD273_05460 [Marinobacter pelagius]|nr:hypothetical protein [Marinobacter sp. C7]